MRLIDAEEFIEWLLDHIWDEDEWYANRNALDELILRKLSVLGYIKVKGDKYVRKGRRKEKTKVPTVDTEPIIRCKDCKYFGYEYGGDGISDSWCNRDDADFMSMSADDFCSRGERR